MGFRVSELHSFISQYKRLKSIEVFGKGSTDILLTTDLASRGIDIRLVELVINYSLPLNFVDFVHRAGRAARGGDRGRCVSIITQYDIDRLKSFENNLGDQMTLYHEFDDREVLKKGTKIEKSL